MMGEGAHAADMQLFHQLFEHRAEIVRHVIAREDGIQPGLDFKRRARLNCIAHLLSLVPYEEVTHPETELPPRQEDPGYRRPPKDSLNWIPMPY